MAEHITINAGAVAIEFHIYIAGSDSANRVNQLAPYFQRLPPQHAGLVYPIFVMKKKPRGQLGGGTWRHREVASQVIGGLANSGVPDDDIKRYVQDRGLGMIGVSQDRWERPPSVLPFSIFHEVGHCVDYSLGLVPPGAVQSDFEGMATDRCGAGNAMVRRAVEAYARWICRGSGIFHALPASDGTAAAADTRLKNSLRRSRAFRDVPATWNPR